MEAGLADPVWTLDEMVNLLQKRRLHVIDFNRQPLAFQPILTVGWVNPSSTATPLTGYRKRAVSASALGATLQSYRFKGSRYSGAFLRSGVA